MQKKNIEVLFVNNLNVVNKDTFVDKKETITKIRLKGSRIQVKIINYQFKMLNANFTICNEEGSLKPFHVVPSNPFICDIISV